MWPGIVIILLLVALLFFVKGPKGKLDPTDEAGEVQAHLPNPFLFDSRKDNDPANVPIRRPRPKALDARGRPITMPLIRWAQAQYQNPQRLDASYWTAVDILRTVEDGGWFLVPGSNAGANRFERYTKPFGQTLPIQPTPIQARWVEGPYSALATPATILTVE